MNEQEIRNLVQSLVSQELASSTFKTGPTSFHVHNGIDSSKIPMASLSNGVIAGFGTMSGGKLDIVNPAINASSIGIAIRANSSSSGVSQISGGLVNGPPLFMRFFEGSFSQTWDIFYIIIAKP